MVTSDKRYLCEHAERGFGGLLDAPTDPANSAVLEHITHCGACRDAYSNYRRMVETIGELPPPHLRHDLTGAIHARIERPARVRAAYWAAVVLVVLMCLAGAGYWLSGSHPASEVSATEARVTEGGGEQAVGP